VVTGQMKLTGLMVLNRDKRGGGRRPGCNTGMFDYSFLFTDWLLNFLVQYNLAR
jgi:hypothetical protein